LGLEPRLAEAVEGITSLVGKDTLRWYARLWDPVAGALYYSNSGRDYEGFGPDLESTKQMISVFMDFSTVNHPAGFIGTMPEDIKEKMISFVDSCLDEDGYFYHPQWGKNIIPSRQGRDLGWATGILRDLGDMPLYDTKNGHKGSLGAPSGVKISDGEETKKDNSTWAAHLQSLDAFKEYLNGMDLKTRSYHCGNFINSQVGQINVQNSSDCSVIYQIMIANFKLS